MAPRHVEARSAGPPDEIGAAPLRGPWWIGKPGSVVERHSSGMDVAIHLKRPTRRLGRVNPRRLRGAPAYLVLLPGGFAVPVLLPVRRWALTPPFHPCLIRLRGHRRFVLCCTFRRVAPPWCYQAQHPAEPGLSSALADSDALIHDSTLSPQWGFQPGPADAGPVAGPSPLHLQRSFRRQGHQPAFPLQILEDGPGGAIGITRGAPQDLVPHPHLVGNEVRVEGARKIRVRLEQAQQQRFRMGVADADRTERQASLGPLWHRRRRRRSWNGCSMVASAPRPRQRTGYWIGRDRRGIVVSDQGQGGRCPRWTTKAEGHSW